MTGFAGFLASVRPDPEDTPGALARALHAPDRPDEPYDDDERQANLLARGYAAGQASDLARRYADAVTALATVQEANEAARRRQERIARDHAAGRITAFDIMRMDAAEPDVAREQELERRAESLRRQVADVSATIAPGPRLDGDGLEAAASRARAAHEEFVQVTRARWAEMQAGRPAARRRAPFAGRGSVAVRSHLECVYCVADNVDAETSALLHHDPEYEVPVTTAAHLAALQPEEHAERHSPREAAVCYSAELGSISR